MTRNLLGWERKEGPITRLHLVEALRVFGLEDNTPIPKDREKASELIANTEPVALAKAHLLQAHRWLDDTAKFRVGLPDGLIPTPRPQAQAKAMADEWVEHLVKACGGLDDESDDSEEDESWAGTKASLAEVEGHILGFEQEQASEDSQQHLACSKVPPPTGSLKTQGSWTPPENITAYSSLKTRGYGGHFPECNLTGFLSSEQTEGTPLETRFNNADTVFAEPIVGNTANRAQRRRAQAASRLQNNIYQHLDAPPQHRTFQEEVVLSPPEILLPEPAAGWDAAIRAADHRRCRELRTEAQQLKRDKVIPLDKQFKPGSTRYGAKSSKLQQHNEARDNLRGLKETHRQENLTQLHKKSFNSVAARNKIKVNADTVFNVPSAISEQPRRKGAKRERRVLDFSNEYVIQAKAHLDARALGINTAPAYEANWKLFLEFCEDHGYDPELKGKDFKADEQLLINYVDFEFMVHNNKFGTIRNKLSAIRWYTLSLGYDNPIEKKHKLKRRLDAIKKISGNRNPKKPVTITMLKLLQRRLIRKAKKGDLWALGITTGCVLGYFFMLRISEFAAEDALHAAKYVLKKKDVKFFREGRECLWYESPDEVSIHITGSKTDQGMEGCHRSMFRSFSELCIVRSAAMWMSHIEGHVQENEPFLTVPVGNNRFVVTRTAISNALKGIAVELGYPSSHIASHSLRSGSATSALQSMDPHLIKILGRWRSDAVLLYTRYTRNLMRDTASLLANTTIGDDPDIQVGPGREQLALTRRVTTPAPKALSKRKRKVNNDNSLEVETTVNNNGIVRG